MSERKLVTVRTIDEIRPIENADAIELAIVGGWQCVVKKGEFKVGDQCLYHEIDSILPDLPQYKFLLAKSGREFERGYGARLRTVKLRSQISMGLALRIEECFYDEMDDGVVYSRSIRELIDFLKSKSIDIEDYDFAEEIGVYKYEKPISGSLAGMCRGNYPSWIPKTDEDRVENLKKIWSSLQGEEFVIEEKLEGSSCTVYIDHEGNVGVTSRNIDLKLDQEGNTFVDTIKSLGIMEAMIASPERNIAIRGELIGPKIEGNIYGLTKNEFRIFNIWDGNKQDYMNRVERISYLEQLANSGKSFTEVPKLMKIVLNHTIEEIVKMATGKSMLADTLREGLVFKSVNPINGRILSFKAISREYLLGEKD